MIATNVNNVNICV